MGKNKKEKKVVNIKDLQELDQEAMEKNEDVIEEAEVVSGTKDVEIQGIGTVRIFFPTSKEDVEVAKYSKELFSDLLMNSKLPTRRGLQKRLNATGDWTEEDDSVISDLETKREEIIQSMRTAGNQENYKNFEKMFYEIHKKLVKKWTERSQLFGNSIEGQCEVETSLLKLYLCCKIVEKDENGVEKTRPLSENFEVFKNEYLAERITDLMYNANSFWSRISESFLEDWLAQISG